MRIYELAKQYNVSAKYIIDLLLAEGIEVKSHMAALSESIVEVISLKLKQYNAINNTDSIENSHANQDVVESIIVSNKNIDSNDQINNNLPNNDNGKKVDMSISKSIVIKPMTVIDFAHLINISVEEVIVTLLRKGQLCSRNTLLSENIILDLAQYYKINVIRSVSVNKSEESLVRIIDNVNGVVRFPVVVVMGHIDHGKTTLLDYIRKTRIAAREKGGITQHLGAYEVTVPQGSLVFLDTPGHEAFSKIRKRGAKIADIAVLVIAADDGIMPQTIESIKAAKTMSVPIIVAINKIDKVDESRLEVVRRQLAQQDLLPEEWGGDTICVGISAKTGQNVDKLLDMIILQSQMMELKANINTPAQGFILESKLEKGRGFVATVICYEGILRVGDCFIVGDVTGKVISLIDSYGKHLKQVYPSIPVLVVGFSALPDIGTIFSVVSGVAYKRGVRESKDSRSRNNQLSASHMITSNEKNINLNMILKADNNSSLEALIDGVNKISGKINDTRFNIMHSGVGNIAEGDIILAQNTKSLVVGYHVKSEMAAVQYARNNNVMIEIYDIIYKFFESLEVRAKGNKQIKMELKKIGEATVLKIFDVKNIGVIAGVYVRDGRFTDKGSVKVLRRKQIVGSGKIKSLQRDKKQVKEVHSGFECAFIVDEFQEWQVDDIIECYLEMVVV